MPASHAAPAQRPPSAFERAIEEMQRQPAGAYPNVSARWLVKALVVTLAGILVLIWLVLCLLYWQGSWQLLYHPAVAVTKTPATVGLAYEPVRFAPDQAGAAQLTGWWVPAEGARFTVLYLHGADGNLSETVEALAALHRAGLTVLAIDYRGYGQSVKGRPSEAAWLEDAGHAVDYLTGTRHVEPGKLIVYGDGLGADLAAELAGRHASLTGVVLQRPVEDGAAAILNDPRSRVVPARWLVRDRWQLDGAAAGLGVPSLWLLEQPKNGAERPPAAIQAARTAHAVVWLEAPMLGDPHFQEELQRWLDDLKG